ncbi:LPS export ABC transporter periplasmic protein LptC [Photobacterium sanctipauli]|uniref:Lipopolysaccharide export system protein LptC n=1 Tax=Photobacterium sanctipauli TaxID=1342794 RepID=A0A2T3NQH2_9GAMM|nr:LPS export ABC transporter periplasmic protein LptC [Photobacterium sanctipauli]PSW18467.1 LPS export ABC transporter periplasmic protein LptC [Photobacterium sanctipauli]
MTLQRLLYVLLIAICAWTGYYLLDKHWQEDVQVAPDAEKPLFTGSSVVNTAFNESGLRSYQIDADYLEHFSNSGNTDFVEPVLWVYRDGTETEWRISSNTARLDKDHVLQMTGNVRIFNLLPESAVKVIQTDTLRLDLVSKDFDTPDHVTITGDAFQNEGTGMKGNMDRSIATLLENVKGRYEAL